MNQQRAKLIEIEPPPAGGFFIVDSSQPSDWPHSQKGRAYRMEGVREIGVPENWLRRVMPVLEREAHSIEVSRHYRGDGFASRRRTAPRTAAEQEFVMGLREIARALGVDLDISV
jgi:hypothetical protein